jgi:hypothetical protein
MVEFSTSLHSRRCVSVSTTTLLHLRGPNLNTARCIGTGTKGVEWGQIAHSDESAKRAEHRGETTKGNEATGTPGKIRTYDLLLRRQTLYPD